MVAVIRVAGATAALAPLFNFIIVVVIIVVVVVVARSLASPTFLTAPTSLALLLALSFTLFLTLSLTLFLTLSLTLSLSSTTG